jgi:hypothetical protein
MKKRLISFIVAFYMLLTLFGCAENGVIKAKNFTPQMSYTAGETFVISDLLEYFENADEATSYTSNVGSIEGRQFRLQLEEGVTTVKITAEKDDKTAVLTFMLNVVADTSIRALEFVPQQQYEEDTEFVLDVSQYFVNTTATTVYTSNMGRIEYGTMFFFTLTEGSHEVEITATEGGKEAVLRFTLNVVSGDSLKALPFTPAESYTEGQEFILNLSEYFLNATPQTQYTSNVGEIENGIFKLTLPFGNVEVRITASEGGKEATLSFTLPVNVTLTQIYQGYAQVNKQRAIEYGRLIYNLYWNPSTQLSKLTPSGGTPYLWPYTEQVAMCNGILKILDPIEDAEDFSFFRDYLMGTIEGLRYYRVAQSSKPYTDTAFGVLSENMDSYAMYNSSRNSYAKDSAGSNKSGIYFDDNIWVAKEMYYAYKNLGDRKYLNECINILNWIIGEGYETAVSAQGAFTNVPMNGIYWLWGVKDIHNDNSTNDSQTASLNACSSAPTAMMLLKVAKDLDNSNPQEAEMKSRFNDIANKITNFMTRVLRTQEGLYKDKVFVRENSEGKLYLGLVDEQVLPYNTGCMMQATSELYELLEIEMILNLNKATAAASDAYFANRLVVEGEYSYNKNSWFTSFLIEGFMSLDKYDENAVIYIDHMRSSLDYAWRNNKASNGLVCPAWIVGWSAYPDNSPNSEGNGRQLLLQSANAHCYANIARYYFAKAN